MITIPTSRTMPSRQSGARAWALIAGVILLGGCTDLDITDTNAPTVEELTDNPTRSVLARAATGIFSQAFTNVGTEIQFYALYGREGYNLLGNDPRETGEQIRGPRDPLGRNSGIWVGPFSAIRTINAYLSALPSASGVTDAERSASAGFAKTLKAWHMHRLAVRTGELGIPIDVDQPIDSEPAPFVSFADAMAAASDLMDEALTDLEAAGGTDFPFTVAPGYDGFDTPATFAQFNRALAAKILVHRATFIDCAECWTAAQNAIDASFVTTAGLPASLATGVDYAFSSDPNETANPVSEPLGNDRLWVHASIVDGAQLQGDGSPDLRLTQKVMDTGRTVELDELIGTHKPVLYNSGADRSTADPGAPIPWINNEELLLLRAEVRWHMGDRQGAIDDIDLIRQHAGGLDATTLTAGSSTDAFVTELLYNRLYSLLWAQGTRWVDARRYGLLESLPVDRSGDSLFENMLVPADECAARGMTPPCQPLTQ